jgi:hypothetical protein
MSQETRSRLLLRAQAAYYGATGVWAVLDRGSFEAVSGPKMDYWLVRMVGALTTATAAALAVGAKSKNVSRETHTLALGSAASFAAIDGYYASRGRISKVYWLDLLVQACIIFLHLRLPRGPLTRSRWG